MLYLISGASRSGKTHLARKLHEQRNLPYLTTDWLMMGFYNGIPDYGIHPLLMPDVIATKIWPFLKAMIDNMLYDGMDYVIEGEAMLPKLVSELISDFPNQINAVFLGYADVDVHRKVEQIKNFSDGENDWLTKESDAYIIDHVKNMIGHSNLIKKECMKHDVPYIDTGVDFGHAIVQAENLLFKS